MAGLSRMQLVFDPWIEAAHELTAARRDHPTFADVRYLLGLLHAARQEPDAAIREQTAALEANPGYRRARFARFVASRQQDGAIDLADWNRNNPVVAEEEPERSLWTAWFLAQADDREGARRVLARLAEDAQWSGPAWYARAVYERGWRNEAGARDALQRCAESHPLCREILERRGWLGARDSGRGVRSFDPGAVLGDADPVAWNPVAGDLCAFLGTLCARQGAAEEARPFYEEAFLRQGRESAHLVRMAQLALARGEEEAAVRALCRAIEVDPVSVPARIALGFEYQSQGFHDEALVQFEVAAKLQPSWPDVQYNLGLLYESQGRGEEAVRCLRRAVDLNPHYFQARTSLSQALLAREAWEEALAELARLESDGIRSADLHVQKAQALLALERVPEATRELEAGAAINPTFARTYYFLGQAYRRLGLRRKARHAWQQYLEQSRSWRELKPAGPGEDGNP